MIRRNPAHRQAVDGEICFVFTDILIVLVYCCRHRQAGEGVRRAVTTQGETYNSTVTIRPVETVARRGTAGILVNITLVTM